MKVAVIVPTTSRNRDWVNPGDSYLSTILIPGLSKLTGDHAITLYLGYDSDDAFYTDVGVRRSIEETAGLPIIWKPFEGCAGNPVGIWNDLGKTAVSDGHDYLFVCGDDIQLDKKKEWLGVFIKLLKKNDNIGWSAGWSNNDEIPTQFLIHKKHIEIMGCVYPPRLRNWYCDNWLARVYPVEYCNWLWKYKHLNLGGNPRYRPLNHKDLANDLVKQYGKRLSKYHL